MDLNAYLMSIQDVDPDPIKSNAPKLSKVLAVNITNGTALTPIKGKVYKTVSQMITIEGSGLPTENDWRVNSGDLKAIMRDPNGVQEERTLTGQIVNADTKTISLLLPAPLTTVSSNGYFELTSPMGVPLATLPFTVEAPPTPG